MEIPGRGAGSSASRDDAAPFDATIDALRSTLSEEPTPNPWQRDLTIVGLLVALFGLAAGYAWLSDQPTPVVAQLEIRSSLDAERAWVAPGFAQGFAAYAQAGNRVRLQQASETRAGSALGALPIFTPGGVAANAAWHIHIHLTHQGRTDTVIATVEMRNHLNDVTHQVTLTGATSALSDMAARAALQVFDWLNIDPFSAAERAAAVAEVPQGEAVAEPYALGLAALWRGEGRQAIDHLEAALVLDHRHPMLNASLAEALEFLGYSERARHAIRVAYDNRAKLSREKQLSIEARLKLLSNDWAGAETLYAALDAFYPEELTYGLALAQAQHRGGQSKRALTTVERLRSGEFDNDPRIDLMEAQLLHDIGDWVRGLTAVRRAIGRAQANGHQGILARALVLQADMDGDPDGNGLGQAQAAFEAMNDPYGRSLVLREQGDRLTASGQLHAAGTAYDEAADISSQVGNEAELARAQQARAIVHDLSGELEAGYQLKSAVLNSFQRRAAYAQAAIMMENIGISLFKMGRLRAAEVQFDDALAEFEAHGDQIGVAWHPYQVGRVRARLGNLSEARALFLSALKNAEARPEGYLKLHTRYELARINLLQGRDGVGSELEALVSNYRDEGLTLDEGDTLVLLSRHAQANGSHELALSHATRAAKIFRASNANYYLTSALTQLVQLGRLARCDELATVSRNLAHRQTALMAAAALRRCPDAPIDHSALLAEARRLELFEPEVALLRITQPTAARQLAAAKGWALSEPAHGGR